MKSARFALWGVWVRSDSCTLLDEGEAGWLLSALLAPEPFEESPVVGSDSVAGCESCALGS